MAIIQTERNRVYAYDPQPDDVFVSIGWSAPAGDGKHLTTHCLPYQPISDYQALVDWAVGMADQLAYPIHVLPLNYSDMRNTGRFTSICDAVASMSDQERGAMRRAVVTTCAEVMRDCDDWQVRADCFDILTQLKVIHHES